MKYLVTTRDSPEKMPETDSLDIFRNLIKNSEPINPLHFDDFE